MNPAGATILGGIAGPDLAPDERAFFREADPWGFILFGRNVDTPDRLRRLTMELRETLGRDVPVLVDQEGGRVQRLRAPHWTDWPDAADLSRAGARAVWLQHFLMGQELAAVGIDVDCAPCLDIATAATHPFLRRRCFGPDAATVTAMGRAAAEGLLAAGVLPVIKHLPGHGRAQVDSHHDLPVINTPLAELERSDFQPFRALADLPLAMTAHIRLTALDERPATAASPVIALIRERIGFDGLLMSDDIGMQALSGRHGERAGAAIAAGCDIVLSCNETIAQMTEVVAAAGRLTAAAARRARTALAWRRATPGHDPAELRAEFASLTC